MRVAPERFERGGTFRRKFAGSRGDVWRVEGITVQYNIALATVASWVILAGLMWFVHKTHLGRAILAVSMDRKGAMVSGIDPRQISMITWAISGALGAIAGVFAPLAYLIQSMSTAVAPPVNEGQIQKSSNRSADPMVTSNVSAVSEPS